MALRSVKGLVAIVTGASSGLGRATATRLSQQGAKVALLDLPGTAGRDIATELESFGDTLFTPADVTKPSEIETALADIQANLGAPRVLVNCAGTGVAKRIYDKKTDSPHDLESWERVMKVNVTGTFNMCRFTIPIMRLLDQQEDCDGERGVIINTASIAAYDAQVGQLAYAASKGALVSMTLCLARDVASYKIRVNTIAPGLFDTELLAKLPEKVKVILASQIPFPERLGKAGEYAHLVQSIIENPMLNGETIRLDGALRMTP